jgi:hypothetical protein
MPELGIVLNIYQCQIQISLNIFSLEEEKYVLHEIWTRDRNQGGLKFPSTYIELKPKGDPVRRKQYRIPQQGRL